MDRKTFALYSLIIGALVGVIGDVLFYRKMLGLSFPLFIGIAIIVILASQRLTRQPLRLRNLWVLIPAFFFALMVAIRDDRTLLFFNMFAALALCALGLYYLPLRKPLDLDAFGDHVFGIFDASIRATFAPFAEIFDSVGWVFDRLQGNWRTVGSVGRGLVIAAPVVLIFGLLLASADAVFASYVDRITALLRFPLMRVDIDQMIFFGGVGWLSCGALAYGVARRGLENGERAAKPKRKLFSLGMIEACIMLGSVDLMFSIFVIIQFAYFFGGRTTLSISGITYADYARQGFFELVAVSVLTLGLVLALDRLTERRLDRHTLIFRALSVLLVALTGVILVSASQRMMLYEDQFGFTALRVYTHVFMFWLALLFVFFLLALFRVRLRIFSLGVLIVLIGYLGTLDLMSTEGYIAARNIARAEENHPIDFWYLSTFSDDAVPAILNLYQTSDKPKLRDWAGQWLALKLSQEDCLHQSDTDCGMYINGTTIFSANVSRDTTWSTLNAIRKSLPAYDYKRFSDDMYAQNQDARDQGDSTDVGFRSGD